jgi:hypothetical protein
VASPSSSEMRFARGPDEPNGRGAGRDDELCFLEMRFARDPDEPNGRGAGRDDELCFLEMRFARGPDEPNGRGAGRDDDHPNIQDDEERDSGARAGSGASFGSRFVIRAMAAAVVVLAVATGATGCVTVRPEQREFLADPSMTFGSGGQAEMDMDHVLENREGSAGAATVSGGGCGCN